MYPVAVPPEVGEDHERLTCVGDAAVAVSPTGTPGGFVDEDEPGDASPDAEPVPIAFIADTRYV